MDKLERDVVVDILRMMCMQKIEAEGPDSVKKPFDDMYEECAKQCQEALNSDDETPAVEVKATDLKKKFSGEWEEMVNEALEELEEEIPFWRITEEIDELGVDHSQWAERTRVQRAELHSRHTLSLQSAQERGASVARELDDAKQQLASKGEQLQAAHEQLHSAQDQARSKGEQLQAAHEQLQVMEGQVDLMLRLLKEERAGAAAQHERAAVAEERAAAAEGRARAGGGGAAALTLRLRRGDFGFGGDARTAADRGSAGAGADADGGDDDASVAATNARVTPARTEEGSGRSSTPTSETESDGCSGEPAMEQQQGEARAPPPPELGEPTQESDDEAGTGQPIEF